MKIKEYRKKAGLSVKDLAAMLGVAPPTVSRYENGKIEKISQSMLKQLAGALNCTVDDLIMDDPEYSYLLNQKKSSSRKKEEEELLRGFYGLSPALQDAVKQICRTGISGYSS